TAGGQGPAAHVHLRHGRRDDESRSRGSVPVLQRLPGGGRGRPGQIGVIFAVGWPIAAIVGLAAPAMARKLGSQKAVAIVRMIPVPFYIMLIFQPVLGLAIFVHWLRISSVSLGWPIDSTYISEVLPARARTAVFGYRSAAWN